ncbi:YjbF family lipoprotein [Chachezhania sediminis]|uniref:YjbF family lipoprotein n=1 Tax=Chachezhania sediminis TaxID=2599291 RepID=UPI00131D7EF3|nr:YjbF family lipoprotein [Chachezhania sediminis]
MSAHPIPRRGVSGLMRALVPALGLSLVLAACGNRMDKPSEAPDAYTQLLVTGQEIAARIKRDRSAPSKPGRALIDEQKVPVIEVMIENRDQTGHAFKGFTRTDDYGGRVAVWRTPDNIALNFRNGMLIGTRGMGWDMVSAGVELRNPGPGPAGGPRTYVFRALDNKAIEVSMACEVADMGPVQLQIDDLSHATRHLRENCRGAQGTVVNDYWIAARPGSKQAATEGGVIWQSRQWAGGNIGYLKIRRISRD